MLIKNPAGYVDDSASLSKTVRPPGLPILVTKINSFEKKRFAKSNCFFKLND